MMKPNLAPLGMRDGLAKRMAIELLATEFETIPIHPHTFSLKVSHEIRIRGLVRRQIVIAGANRHGRADTRQHLGNVGNLLRPPIALID